MLFFCRSFLYPGGWDMTAVMKRCSISVPYANLDQQVAVRQPARISPPLKTRSAASSWLTTCAIHQFHWGSGQESHSTLRLNDASSSAYNAQWRRDVECTAVRRDCRLVFRGCPTAVRLEDDYGCPTAALLEGDYGCPTAAPLVRESGCPTAARLEGRGFALSAV